MRVLHGQVSVFGFIADKSTHSIELCSPYNHHALVIDAADPLFSDLSRVHRAERLPLDVTLSSEDDDELQQLLEDHLRAKSHVAVIVLKSLADTTQSIVYQYP